MLAPNTLLQDRYLVMRLLGQGGMGAVYHATDRKFGNAVALKETFYNDLQLRKAFSHEARLLNRLRHAALPVVTDYFAIGDRQFLVMQYIPGKDLEQLLNERKAQGQGVFVTSQVLRWADQLLDALEYLHSQTPPIIHRDIKPQNLKLTPRGEVILLDFGLAKGIVTHQSQVSQSIRGYTPNYASLEQIRGTGTDARSDIYSIGATIYHLLTGEMPQDALTRIAAILMGQPDPLKPISSLNPAVSAATAQVIEKAMAAHPDQRYASAAAMRQALRSAATNNQPVSLHKAQTLTDEPMKVNMVMAAAEASLRSGGPALQQAPEASPAEPPGPDHVIILLDKLDNKDQKTPERDNREKDLREGDSRGKGLQERDSQGNKIQEQSVSENRPAEMRVPELRTPQMRVPELRTPQMRAPEMRVQEHKVPENKFPERRAPENKLRGREAWEKAMMGASGQKNEAQGKAVRGKNARGKQTSVQPNAQANLRANQPTSKEKSGERKTPMQRLLSRTTVFILVVLVLCAVVYKAVQKRPELQVGAAQLFSETQANLGGPSLAIKPMRAEVLRYYLEVVSPSNKAEDAVTQVNGLMPLEGGTKFKFHLKPAEGGYLYILALGKNGVPQTFLTSQPMPSSGVTTNWSNAGADFHFPDGGQWFMIQKDAENTPFTVIFSKTPLESPAFLTSQSGRDLTPAERQELMELRKQYAPGSPDLVAMMEGNKPAVSVQASVERSANEPIIFDISIKRK
jgi:serine/threonine protein kinase